MGENLELDHQWEDAIDVDDSDLLPLLCPLPSSSASASASDVSSPLSDHRILSRPFSLRPCSQSSSLSQTLAPKPSPSPPRPSSPASLLLSPPVVREEEGEAPFRTTATLKRRIPGPAGAIQEAMRRRSEAVLAGHEDSSYLQDQQWDDQSLGLGLEDGDFKLNPWLCAMEFLGVEAQCTSTIGSIKTLTVERVSQVVGIVKSCSSNGLGDLFLTLKDPSGSISASVHRGVLLEHSQCGDISVGCVLVLKQVVVFSPSRSVCYLNVTKSNVAKLISKDCGPPGIQAVHSVAAQCGSSAELPTRKSMQDVFGMTRKNLPLHDRNESSIAMESRRGSEISSVSGIRENVASSSFNASFPTSCLAEKICRKFVGTVTRMEVAKPSNAGSSSRATSDVRAASGLVPASTYLQQDDLEIQVGAVAGQSETHGATVYEESRTSTRSKRKLAIENTDTAGCFINGTFAKVSQAVMPLKSDHGLAEAEKQVPKVSVAQWTDEQLLELFSDYQDEAGLF